MKPDLSKPLEDLRYPVDPAFHRTRLDLFLKGKLSWRSRNSIQSLIETRQILVNGSSEGLKRSRRLLEGDEVRVLIPPPADGELRHDSIPLHILYEDEVMLALDKQPGIICHPVSRNLYNTLINALHHRYRNMEDPDRDVIPRLAHRLDRDTSGVLLVAKTARIRAILQRMIERGQVKKTYRAIVTGSLEGDEGRIAFPIGKDPTGRSKIKMAVREDGLPSLTTWKVVERFARFTEIDIDLHTGRTHQIRVHMSSLGHPVAGDPLYGDESETAAESPPPRRHPTPPRLCLHARKVRFDHPGNGRPLEIVAEIPEDFIGFRRLLASETPATDQGLPANPEGENPRFPGRGAG